MFSVYTLISGKISMSEFSGAETGSIITVMQRQNQFDALQRMEQLQANAQSSVSVLFVVWCVGMALLAVFFAVSYLRCLREFKTALPVRSHYVEQWLKECPLKRLISIRQSDKISSPLTYGIFRPVILMPKKTDWDNEMELQYVLTHEYVHIYRFDAVTKLIVTAALCVHWFNPFVWVMYILFNRDIEMVCDESVIRMSGEKSKSIYSLMLIDMEAKKSGLLPLCNNFSKNSIEERITAIMKTKKTTFFSLVTACLIVAGTTTVFATSAPEIEPAGKVFESVEIDSKSSFDTSRTGVEYEIPIPELPFTQFSAKKSKNASGTVEYFIMSTDTNEINALTKNDMAAYCKSLQEAGFNQVERELEFSETCCAFFEAYTEDHTKYVFVGCDTQSGTIAIVVDQFSAEDIVRLWRLKQF